MNQYTTGVVDLSMFGRYPELRGVKTLMSGYKRVLFKKSHRKLYKRVSKKCLPVLLRVETRDFSLGMEEEVLIIRNCHFLLKGGFEPIGECSLSKNRRVPFDSVHRRVSGKRRITYSSRWKGVLIITKMGNGDVREEDPSRHDLVMVM